MSPKRLPALLALVAILTGLLVAVAPNPAAAAWPSSTVDLVGHGWGHGRGMGQYGALGYALHGSEPHGWDHHRILAHYYGNTVAGTIGNPQLHVQLTQLDGKVTTVQQERGAMVSNSVKGAYHALRAIRTGTNTFRVEQATSCDGPWSLAPGGEAVEGPVVFAPLNSTDNHQDMVQACGFIDDRGQPERRWYRGNIEAHDYAGLHQITLNLVHMEGYLRGVVPRESPASWGDLGDLRPDTGQREGMEALKAQAVAARSYAWSEGGWPRKGPSGPARTCDTIFCQVYGGRARQNSYGFASLEDGRTDAAVAGTAGAVRLRDGVVARTEFSSSTGGHTAGGRFPAVPDAGDAISLNPNHRWSASIPVSTIEARFGRGRLVDIEIRKRNGLGALGGRVTELALVFEGGTVVRDTDDEIRSAMGSKSSWFAIVNRASFPYHVVTRDGGVHAFGGAAYHGSLPEIGVSTPARDMAEGPGGYWILGEDGGVFSFNVPFHGSMGGQRLNAPVVGIAPTAKADGYWMVAGDGGIFSFNAPFYGSTGNMRLNAPVVAMAPTTSGQGYWLVATDGGIFTFGDAAFFGSTGGIRLNEPVFAMAPTRSGQGYWLVARDGGVFTFGDARFHGSLPQVGVRETAVELLPSPEGAGYLIVTAEGRVYGFGDASSGGGPRNRGVTSPAVGAGVPR